MLGLSGAGDEIQGFVHTVKMLYIPVSCISQPCCLSLADLYTVQLMLNWIGPWPHLVSQVWGLQACTTILALLCFYSLMIYLSIYFWFFETEFLCSFEPFPGSHSVDQAGLELQRSACLCLSSPGMKRHASPPPGWIDLCSCNSAVFSL